MVVFRRHSVIPDGPDALGGTGQQRKIAEIKARLLLGKKTVKKSNIASK